MSTIQEKRNQSQNKIPTTHSRVSTQKLNRQRNGLAAKQNINNQSQIMTQLSDECQEMRMSKSVDTSTEDLQILPHDFKIKQVDQNGNSQRHLKGEIAQSIKTDLRIPLHHNFSKCNKNRKGELSASQLQKQPSPPNFKTVDQQSQLNNYNYHIVNSNAFLSIEGQELKAKLPPVSKKGICKQLKNSKEASISKRTILKVGNSSSQTRNV